MRLFLQLRMSLYITSLNSGSNGNCYYIGNDHEAVLVDVGLSCRETEKRMRRLDLPMESVKAIFISHEHTDHVRGMQTIVAKYRLPVYVTPPTLQGCRTLMEHGLVNTFTAYQPVTIGGLTITAFPKIHDAADPHSFLITGNGVCIGVITDIGAACEHVINNFRQCHAVILEANYDEHMLERGTYPHHLKQRIRGGQGHISNRQAYELVREHRPAFMSHILLGHLSQNNNRPELVSELFSPLNSVANIVIASRFKETEVYAISAGTPPAPEKKARVYSEPMVQASLF